MGGIFESAARGGVRWWVRLMIDRASAAKAGSDVRKTLDDATNSSKAKANIRSIGSEFDSLGNKVRLIGGIVSGLFAGFTVIAAVRGLIDINRQLEKFIAQLTTMQGSRGAALQTFSFIEKFAVDTPFQIDEITQAFIDLRTVGVAPTEMMLTRLGDHASAFGGRIQDLAHAFVRATTGEMEALKAFGVNASVIGDQITFTFRGHSETVRRNANDIIQYLMKISKANFAGSMDREMDTLNGTISNLQDSLANIARAIGTSGLNMFLREITQDMLNITENTYSNRRAIAQWTQGTIAGIKFVIEMFRLLASVAFNTGQAIGEAIMSAFNLTIAELMILSNKLMPGTKFDLFSDKAIAERMDAANRRSAGMVANLKEIGAAFNRAGQAAADFSVAVNEPYVPGRMPAKLPNLGAGEVGTGTTGKQPHQKTRMQQIQEEIKALDALQKIRHLTNAELAEMNKLERELAEALKKKPGVAARADIEGGIQDIRDIRQRIRDQTEAMSKMQANAMLERIQYINKHGFGGAQTFEDNVARLIARAQDMQDAFTNAAYGASSAWGETFKMLLDGSATIGRVIEKLARGIAGSMLGGVAQYASAKMAENIALAVEENAKGVAALSSLYLAGTAPGHFAAAGAHKIAAVKWGLLAGIAAGAQSAVSGGAGGRSGGIPSGARDAAGRLAEGTQRSGPPIIFNVYAFDKNNPNHQRELYEAQKDAEERYGTSVTVNRR